METVQRYKKVVSHIRSEFKFYIAIVVGTAMAFAWVNTEFLQTSKAMDMMDRAKQADDELRVEIKSLAVEIKTSNELLLIHIDRYILDKVMSDIKTNETEQFKLEQFTRVNGTNSQSEERSQDLKIELKALEQRRTCIINNNPLCD